MSKIKLLIIDDDQGFCRILKRRLEQYDVDVTVAHSAEQAFASIGQFNTVLLDMMLGNDNGLSLIEPLNEYFQPKHLIVLTGYASIATTVEAIKRGATDYLTKPVGTPELLARLLGEASDSAISETQRLSPSQIEWEHIQRTLHDNDGNISKTARDLGMHRRTLQRKLAKRSPH
ncbi:MAG: response regulator [Idiomarina sp.]|nr:response regulator [Idiomarina sp.]